MADKPRAFSEVVAATDPAVRERIERAEHYLDTALERDFHADVILMEDRDGNGDWMVGYQDDDGGCYETTFSGPEAERRAHGYFEALKSGRIKTMRAASVEH